jgi:hypothetical protein
MSKSKGKPVVRVVPQMFRDITKCPGIKRTANVPVLAKWGDRELWVVPCGYYHNRGKHSVPGYVVLVSQADKEWRNAYSEGRVEISKSSRLSQKLFFDKAKVIEEFFGGAEIAHLLAKGRTVLVEDATTAVALVPAKGGTS